MTTRKFIAVVLSALVAAMVLYQLIEARTADAAPLKPTPVSIMAIPLPLSEAEPARRAVGKARYVAGWALTASSEDFGGFSGLVWADGELTAISDAGDWLQAPFDARAAAAPTRGEMRGFIDGDIVLKKIQLDAESLIRFAGGYLVSFEQRHRLDWVPAPGAEPAAVPGLAPFNLAGLSNNGGLEAIAELAPGSIIAFAERGRDPQGRLKVWYSAYGAEASMLFAPPKSYAPTDAARLPNGDLLLLLRYYSNIDGVSVKLLHIAATDIQPGAVLRGTEILHLSPEMTVDNMEALDVVAIDDNTVRLIMMSDDNFNPLQRTLLTIFDYDYK